MQLRDTDIDFDKRHGSNDASSAQSRAVTSELKKDIVWVAEEYRICQAFMQADVSQCTADAAQEDHQIRGRCLLGRG